MSSTPTKAPQAGAIDTILLPIETKAREFTAKLLASCFMSEAGFRVFLGGHLALYRHISRLPRGIYIEKAIHNGNLHDVAMQRVRGNRAVAWCEEGLTIYNRDFYCNRRVSTPLLEYLDAFYAWGQLQGDAILSKAPEFADRLVLAGNPRLDLLRAPFRAFFATEAEALKREHGRFILINTNFLHYNNYYGTDYYLNKKELAPDEQNEAHLEYLRGLWAYSKTNFEHYVPMVETLCQAFPDHKIIVRPHPSENHSIWREKTAHLENARILFQGAALPWILASEVMIHNNCTTSVEGFMLEKPVVSYRPVVNEAYAQPITQAVSRMAHTLDELIEAIKTSLENGPLTLHNLDPESAALVRYYIATVEGPFACERIVESLCDISQHKKLTKMNRRASLPFRRKEAELRLRGFAARVLGRDKEDTVYSQQKFPGISAAECNAGIAVFAKSSGRFGKIVAVPWKKDERIMEIKQM